MRARRLTLLGFAVLFAAACCAAFGDTWLADDFDDYDLGVLDGQGGWSGNAAVRVVLDFAGPGRCAGMDCRNWGDGEVSKSVSSGGGFHYIDFDAAMNVSGSAPPGQNLSYIKFFDGSDAEITRFYFSRDQFKVLLAPANQTVIVNDVSNLTWYHIRLGINLTTSRMSVWVDGDQKIDQQSTYGSGTSIGQITVAQWPDSSGLFDPSETYVDNFVCNSALELGIGVKILSPQLFPGWQAQNVCYPCVIYDGGTGEYTMYYAGTGTSHLNESAWDQWTTGLVTSTSITDWKFPDNYEAVLQAHKFYEGDVVDPQAESAIFDSIFAYGACIIEDGGTFKMWYTGWNGDSEHLGGGLTRKVNFRIGHATSPDGVTWTKHAGSAGAGAVLGVGGPGDPDSKGASHPHILKEGSTYKMWYEAYDGSTYRIRYATSSDGTNWTKQGTVLEPSTAYDSQGTRNPVVVSRNGQYELWYEGRSTTSPKHHVLRAYSADGVSWNKFAGELTLHPDAAPAGEERIIVDSILVAPDGSCQIFYAKQTQTIMARRYGNVERMNYYIYTELVNP